MVKSQKYNKNEQTATLNQGKNSYNKKRNNVTNQTLMQKYTYTFTRDAEWFKKTMEKIEQVKQEMDSKFYTDEKRRQKIDFIRKMQVKLKDYKDAIKFTEKYKMVKFFERKKLEKNLKRINKEIEDEKLKKDVENEPKLKELSEKKDQIVGDINYVKFYPKTYKYYSLFPKNDKDNAETKIKIENMRKKIDFYVSFAFNFQLNKTKKNKNSEVENKEEVEKEEEGENVNVNENENANEITTSEKKEEKISKEDKKLKNKNSSTKNSNLNYEQEAARNRYSRYSKIEDDDFFIIE